ncbi:DUF2304 domain-containing protein [Collinsella stercoris]|uniref:DUF2304 domain-containing protein n=1 Tax=Collinsella stercoris DSM 13279 TaxID=445975 RepID=B6GCA3_9ACTN|nr:DUF2304 domain-containing protein [Collinsella stercoris]EEA90106.1 hypothetical protein COLSTE_01726 [Collinsella stercoris DSM 13279]UEA46049.1 DUF2304 domain-containing protein [Collinsella stercoris DSM 13279]UWP11434.1 DUF2304 domain-containing protein [Collinsella stercoris]
MTVSLRVLLVASAIFVLVFVVRKIRKSQLQVLDAVFWLFFSLSFVILALFPQIASTLASLLGFQAASNFVFLYVIAVLVVRDFSQTVKLARLRERFNILNEEIALREISK